MGGVNFTGTNSPSDSTCSGRSTERFRSDTLSCESSIAFITVSIWAFLMTPSSPAPLNRRGLQERPELRLIDAIRVGFLRADPLLLEHFHDRIVEGLHPELFTYLDGRGDLEGLVLPDQVGDGRCAYHDLERGAPSLLVTAFEESLR